MRKTTVLLGLSVLLVLGGCSSRPISKTWHHLKKGYNATRQVYHAAKAVAEVVNPLEYVYVSGQGEALTPEGEPFVTKDAILGDSPEEVE